MKTKEETKEYRRKWRLKHKDRLNEERREWAEEHREERREQWDVSRFGGNRQEVYERDNFQCQHCGMTQEQHILLFDRKLHIHHVDGKGRHEKIPNSEIDNLITLCIRCHTKVHNKMNMERRWGDLLKQDDSEYLYPEIRKIIQSKKEKLGTLEKAKQELADELGVAFFNIDHKYYDRKDALGGGDGQ